MRLIFFLFSVVILLVFSSCKETLACFQVVSHNNQNDSIFVGDTVRFSAFCSENAKEFFWDFGNEKVGFGDVVSTVYDSAGLYHVSLSTLNQKATSTQSKDIIVFP